MNIKKKKKKSEKGRVIREMKKHLTYTDQNTGTRERLVLAHL